MGVILDFVDEVAEGLLDVLEGTFQSLMKMSHVAVMDRVAGNHRPPRV